jgi:hypothetical protein
MILAIYTRATDGMQDATTVALEEPFLDPAVDTPLSKGSGNTAKALCFSAICRTLRSGGTRIRTGDTMIFSHVLYQLSYPARGSGSGKILRHEGVAIKRPAGP